MGEDNIIPFVNSLRSELGLLEKKLRSLTEDIKKCDIIIWDKWECIAQSILAVRQLECSRMRLGKVIQYYWDWVSIYDKEK